MLQRSMSLVTQSDNVTTDVVLLWFDVVQCGSVCTMWSHAENLGKICPQ